MNPHAEEMRNNARQFQTWADAGGVHLSASTLRVYAEAMAEAAHALGLQEWRGLTVQRPPAAGTRQIVRERLRVVGGTEA